MDLQAYLIEHEKPLAEFAAAIGVTPTALDRYIKGVRTPRLTIMAKIAEQTDGKVTANDLIAVAQAAYEAKTAARVAA